MAPWMGIRTKGLTITGSAPEDSGLWLCCLGYFASVLYCPVCPHLRALKLHLSA